MLSSPSDLDNCPASQVECCSGTFKDLELIGGRRLKGGGGGGVKCSIEFYMTLFSALAAAAPDSGRLAPASTTPVNQLRSKRGIFLYDVN